MIPGNYYSLMRISTSLAEIILKGRTLTISPSNTQHHHITQFHNCNANNHPMPLAPTPAKNLHIRLKSVPMGSPHNSQHRETLLLVDPLLTIQLGTPIQPQKVLTARTVFSSSYSHPCRHGNGMELMIILVQTYSCVTNIC